MAWLFLGMAILLDVGAVSALKLSQGFTRALPTGLALVQYALCFASVAMALRGIEISALYAIWSGVGTALVAITGAVFFGEAFGALKLGSIVLIVLGVVGLNLAGISR